MLITSKQFNEDRNPFLQKRKMRLKEVIWLLAITSVALNPDPMTQSLKSPPHLDSAFLYL